MSVSATTLGRRALLAGVFGGVLGAGPWLPAGRIAATAAETPAGFPSGLTLYRSRFENWCGEIAVEDVWTCAPTAAADVVALANWAAGAGWRVRPRGMMHSWSPIVLGDGAGDVVLLDLTQHLTSIAVRRPQAGPSTVRVGPGALLTDILTALKAQGLGLASYPAIGEVTVAGVLAIGGHGAGLPNAQAWPGPSFGSLADLVLELTAVVWEPARRAYVQRTFTRTDPAIAPLLVGLGRIPVVEVVLKAMPDALIRCLSRVDITAADFYGATAGPRSLAALTLANGGVDAVLFPYTDKPWIKIWSVVEGTPPPLSRRVDAPYNYPFTDQIPAAVAELPRLLVTGAGEGTPVFGQAMYDAVVAGLTATATHDIHGPGMDVQLWTRASSLPVNDLGLVVLCRRADLQSVTARVYDAYIALQSDYRAAGEYPTNMPLHLRATGTDRPDSVTPGAVVPSFSAAALRPDHPEWDVALWVNVLTLPGTPSAPRFCRDLEQRLLAELDGETSAVRVEWSKNWAYTDAGPWADQAYLSTRIPASFDAGREVKDRWARVSARLAALDPRGVFATSFHDRLLE